MKKFWKWMEKKYSLLRPDKWLKETIKNMNIKTGTELIIYKDYCKYPIQMLVGYMIEYLLENKMSFEIWISGYTDIKTLYTDLIEEINEIGKY